MKSARAYFVEKLRRAILAHWPEWGNQIEDYRTKSNSDGFCLTIPSPNLDATRGLLVMIEMDRLMVIIGFDDDHDHLTPRRMEKQPAFRQRVIQRIDDLLHDRIFAISWRENGALRTSSGFRDRAHNQFVEAGFACRIRSWSGKHDRDFIEK